MMWHCTALRILWDSGNPTTNGDCRGTGSRTSLLNITTTTVLAMLIWYLWLKSMALLFQKSNDEIKPRKGRSPIIIKHHAEIKGRYLSHSRIKMRKKIPVRCAQIGSLLHNFLVVCEITLHKGQQRPCGLLCSLIHCSAYHFPYISQKADSYTRTLI